MENDFDFQEFFNLDFELDYDLADTIGIGTSLQNLDLGVDIAIGDIFTTPFQEPVSFEPFESRFTELDEDEAPGIPALQTSNVTDPSLELQTQSADIEADLNISLLPAENAISATVVNAQPENINFSTDVALQKKKRTRVDRHKRKTGPNPYGRRGNLRCGQCRKRNSKCIYASEWLPCEFCCTRNVRTPCVKLPGPKAASRLSPSRQIPTAIDAVVPAEDVLLLQYAYSRNDFLLDLFFKQLAKVYGTAIDCLSLRHAMLAYSASWLPESDFQTALYHHHAQACSALRSKMTSPAGFGEEDIFTSLILAWSTYLSFPKSEEVGVHINGCISMVQAMSRRSGYKAISDVFTVFQPFVQECIHSLSILTGCSSLRPLDISFKKRVACRGDLYRANNLPVRQSEWMEYDMLRGSLEATALYTCFNIYRISRDERSLQPLKRDTLDYIRRELTDPDLGHTWKQLQLSWELESWWSITLSTGTLEFAEALLMRPEIPEGLSSPLIAGMACNLVSYVRSLIRRGLASRAECVEYFRKYGCNWLPLVGLALRVEDIPDLGGWVMETLRETGCSETASTLNEFWKSPTSANLHDVVGTVARFSIVNRLNNQ